MTICERDEDLSPGVQPKMDFFGDIAVVGLGCGRMVKSSEFSILASSIVELTWVNYFLQTSVNLRRGIK